MKISVILTVKNEGESIRPLLDSLHEQTRLPDEVVIVDGGSTDNTVSVIEEYGQWLPIRVIEAPGANISEGRNLAIAAAHGPIIAATDAGVMLGPTWLADITRPLAADEVMVVSGWFEPDPFTDFEVVLGATVLPDLNDIDPARFLPSSRSIAFRKVAWAAVGGYPEWLDYGEDLIFDLNLREQYGSFPFVRTAVAYYRPRGSMRSFFRQYFFYARGDGKANLWLARHLVRYATYLVALPWLLAQLWHGRRRGWLLLGLGGGIYSHRPAQRLLQTTVGWSPAARARGLALIPLLRLVGDVAKMIGYPVGVIWRWRHRRS